MVSLDLTAGFDNNILNQFDHEYYSQSKHIFLELEEIFEAI